MVPVVKLTRLKCPAQNCVSFLFIFICEMIHLYLISLSSALISRCGASKLVPRVSVR